LAGLHAGVWPDVDAIRQLTQTTTPFVPQLDEPARQARLAQWHRAVQAVVAFYRDAACGLASTVKPQAAQH
jgi:glycerol kinase